MVRLVFRPYTQVWRTICTSVSLRASTRVSSGFTLLRHSSPSFGSQQICSNSNLSKNIQIGWWCKLKNELRIPTSARRTCLYFHYAWRFATSALAYMLDSLVRVSRRVVYNHFANIWSMSITRMYAIKAHAADSSSPRSNPLLQAESSHRNEDFSLPFFSESNPCWPVNKDNAYLINAKKNHGWLTLHHNLLAPYQILNSLLTSLVAIASLLTISGTFNSLFKVLFIFPSQYLFAIGLSPVFSFGWDLPPIRAAFPNNPTHWKRPVW